MLSEEVEIEANMRHLQKRTCLSIFMLHTNALSSECAKAILETCWLRIFDLLLWFFEKFILAHGSSVFEHFVRKSLLKMAAELQKNWKRWFFSIFKKWSYSRYMTTVRFLGASEGLKLHFSLLLVILKWFEAIFEKRLSHPKNTFFKENSFTGIS